jgi:hypothetical protein
MSLLVTICCVNAVIPKPARQQACGMSLDGVFSSGLIPRLPLVDLLDDQETTMFRYALTIFLSAFLLFQVQPLIGRFVLPWFGGGPSIWTTCMLFFQLLLLAGYLYSHLLSTRVRIQRQVVIHVTMLALSLLFLPIVPSDALKPTSDQSPSWQILWLLLATVGGPYFILSTTGPLLQRWFSRTSPGTSPYRLYALSNVGSLLALLSYPFLFEPWMRLRQQAVNWTIAYIVFAGLILWCAVRLWRHSDHESDETILPPNPITADLVSSDLGSPRWRQKLLWLAPVRLRFGDAAGNDQSAMHRCGHGSFSLGLTTQHLSADLHPLL